MNGFWGGRNVFVTGATGLLGSWLTEAPAARGARVTGTIRSALRGEAPIIRSDGKFIRDYFYVRDAVGAYLRLAEKLAEGFAGEAFNFGNETPVSVLELVQ
ncbi:MAG TPA: NAD-dependent epimerase/dehydratase family protein [Bryobacteraceae bacterium]|nr:NAD-dependent epimerase/dehydratase family protein [Bryobacteraceae bacterium]